MKLLNFTAKNFGSYEEISFTYEEGLVLISGPTGSGKSTFQDIPFWGLFGITAKGGSVDDVRSWVNPNGPTEVKVSLSTPSGDITVYRTRGKPNENDLYWIEDSRPEKHLTRGKDIRETQKLLETRIEVSADNYQISAYFHEFSPTSHFFVANSKAQRILLESVANLEWPIKLVERIQTTKKILKTEFQALDRVLQHQKGKHEQLLSNFDNLVHSILKWEDQKQAAIGQLRKKSENFNINRYAAIKKYQDMSSAWEEQKESKVEEFNWLIASAPDSLGNKVCKDCGQPNKKVIEQEFQLKNLKRELDSLVKAVNPHLAKIQELKDQFNHYEEQIATETNKENPFLGQHETLVANTNEAKILLDEYEVELQVKKSTLSRLETLYDYTFELRGQLLNNSVKAIERTSNEYLNDYFDAEIKLGLEIEGSDNLKLTLYKSGHECNFKQLSKGQRGLLNLCFTVAVMKASANRAGVHFNQVFFDEALSGFDADLKVKAFRLFQHLNKAHPSIYLIDHSTEFKSLFDKQYKVEIISDISTIVVDE